ncbi:transposase [Streptomyces sp. NPDC054838]
MDGDGAGHADRAPFWDSLVFDGIDDVGIEAVSAAFGTVEVVAPDGRTGHPALGRSRGGLTTKIHLGLRRTRPTPGHTADPRPTARRHLRVCPARTHPSGPHRPRCRTDHVIADKVYSSRGFRAYLRKRGIGHTIAEKSHQKWHRHNRGRRGGRPTGFGSEIYRRRNTVERCFNQLKGFRGIAARYEKTTTSYEAAVTLVSLLLWARSV